MRTFIVLIRSAEVLSSPSGVFIQMLHTPEHFQPFPQTFSPLRVPVAVFCCFFSSPTVSPSSVPVLLSSQPLQDSQAREAGAVFSFALPALWMPLGLLRA